MTDKNKMSNKNKVHCERCQRPGHLAKDCYALLCDYCKKVGHMINECRTLLRDKKNGVKIITQSGEQEISSRDTDGDTKHTPQDQCPENQATTGDKSISNIDIEMANLSTIGAYRVNLMSPHKDVIEISTPELKGQKARMIVGINCPITMMKIGKLKDNVTAAKEVLTLEDAFGARVKTICLICLSIRIKKKTVLHPCRVISDDFYIETDGVLGNDFISKSTLHCGKHLELAGVKMPFIINECVRGILRVDELVEVPNTDSDSDTVTDSN